MLAGNIFTLATHLLTLASCSTRLTGQPWELGCCKLKHVATCPCYEDSSPPLTNYTRKNSIILSQSHLGTWHQLTPFYCLFPMSQFSTLLKGLVSSESLALSLCAQGSRSLIKMLNKTHLSSNLDIMLTPFKEVPVLPYPLFLLSKLLPSLGQNTSLPVPQGVLAIAGQGRGGRAKAFGSLNKSSPRALPCLHSWFT